MTGRVLVVDDEPIIRRFLAEGLSDAGYQVLIARDGAEALDSVYRFHPDAVLLDLLMPGVDGWAFLRERRVQPALAALPVVVFSAAGREGLHDASALRATAVLPKPLNLDVLAAVLEHVLSDSRKYQVDAANAAAAAADGFAPVDGSSTKRATAHWQISPGRARPRPFRSSCDPHREEQWGRTTCVRGAPGGNRTIFM